MALLSFFVLATSLALFSHTLIGGDTRAAFFVAYGHLFSVDAQAEKLHLRAGGLHMAAVSAAVDPEGLLWARSGSQTLGAVNPRTGTMVAEVVLPDAPYDLRITEGGKAYVTHTTLTADGFLLSVVDTNRKRYVGNMKGIQGLVTGLAYRRPYLYLAASGVRRPGHLYLYRIDTVNNTLVELHRRPSGFYRWEIAFHNERLVLVRASGPWAVESAAPRVELYDPHSKGIRPVAGPERFPDIHELTGPAWIEGDRLLVPGRGQRGRGVAVLDLHGDSHASFVPIAGGVSRIVALRGDRLVYLDGLFTTGQRGRSLYFYDLEAQRELARISILEAL